MPSTGQWAEIGEANAIAAAEEKEDARVAAGGNVSYDKDAMIKQAIKRYSMTPDMARRWVTDYIENYGEESYDIETFKDRTAQAMEYGVDSPGIFSAIDGEGSTTALPHEQEGWKWLEETLDEIESPEFVESPEYERPEYQAGPEYEGSEYTAGPEYEGSEFQGFEPEGGWGEFESELFGEWMDKVSPGIEAEMASRGLSRSSDFERAYGFASVEGARRASEQSLGMQRDEMARETSFESEEARREQEYGMSEAARRSAWEADEARYSSEHASREATRLGEWEQDQALRQWEAAENAARRQQEHARYLNQQEWDKKLAGREELYNYYNLIGGTQNQGFDYNESYMPSGTGETEWEAAAGTAGETISLIS